MSETGIKSDDNPTGPMYCHFTEMEYCCSDSDDIGGYDEWLECKHCGHTRDVPPEFG